MLADTNLGPLTTAFTPPSTCFYTTAFPATVGLFDVTGAGLGFAQTQLEIVSNVATACYPSGYGGYGDSSHYFSPGICPSGYSTGIPSTVSEETQALCCPSGFHQDGNYNSCSKTLTGVLTVSAVLTRTTTGLEFYLDSLSTQFSSSTHTLEASGIPIRWRAGDLSSSDSKSSMSAGSGSALSSSDSASSTSSASNPSSSTSSNSSSGGYSTSDKIALGVGIGVGVPGALAACVTIWSKCCKQRRPQ